MSTTVDHQQDVDGPDLPDEPTPVPGAGSGGHRAPDHGPSDARPAAHEPAARESAARDSGDVQPADVERADVRQDGPTRSPAQLRVDFGAHLEANYQRLVAQLYAITLNPGAAHDAVQDAYSRAWRHWATVSRTPDPTSWVRRVAVRSTISSWRGVLRRVGIGRPQPIADGVDLRTGALLTALGRLPAAERRSVVLAFMAGASVDEIAAVEQVPRGTVQARLARARLVVTEGMIDVLPDVSGDARHLYDVADDHGEPDAYAPELHEPDLYDPVYDNRGEHR